MSTTITRDLAQNMVGKTKPGPEPDRVKIEGNWEEAVKRTLAKKRPPEGWPRPQKKRRSKKSAK